MAWLAVDKDKEEVICENELHRAYTFHEGIVKSEYEFWQAEDNDDFRTISLPKGSIEKLIGKKLTWEDEPVELKEKVLTEHEKQEMRIDPEKTYVLDSKIYTELVDSVFDGEECFKEYKESVIRAFKGHLKIINICESNVWSEFNKVGANWCNVTVKNEYNERISVPMEALVEVEIKKIMMKNTFFAKDAIKKP